MPYLLDTNILVHLVRNSAKGVTLEQDYGLLSKENNIYISAVTKGEILSFSKQSAWGKPKMGRLFYILETLSSIPINGDSPLMDAYADINAYSQGKHPEFLPLEGFSAKNMGKNDLWIAATAFLLDIPLLTTDLDFNHLHPNFITVHQV